MHVYFYYSRFKISSSLFAFRGSWQERDLQLRDKVKDVVECDVNKPNPLSGTVLENVKFEVITSCFCISAAVLTIEDFRKALKNIRYLNK